MGRYDNFRNSLTYGSSRSNNPSASHRSFKLSLFDFLRGPSGSQDYDLIQDEQPNFNSEDFVSEFISGIKNWWRGFTGSGLTDRDIQQNQQNMQNVEDTAAAQVRGFEKAGVNSALMYGNGASNTAPQSSSTGGSGSLSDLMQLLMLPAQLKLMNAQAKNTDADTQKTMADTEQVKLALKYYPSLTEKTIAEIAARTDLDIQNTSESKAREEVAKFEAILKKTESEYADAYFDLRNQGEAAKRDAALESAAESCARAAWTEFETQWTKDHNGARPSSSSLLALIEAMSSWFGVENEQQGIITRAVSKVIHPNQGEPDNVATGNMGKPLTRAYLKFRRKIRGHGLIVPDY